MKINVTENKVSIKEEQILNENEYNIHKIQFDFSSEYTDDLVKVALFSIDNHTYKKIISNNECDIPPEVLTQRGYSILGVYAYKTEQDTLVLRYSPSPTKISVYDGSYKADAENSEPITPSEIEQYQQILQNSLQQFQNQYNALVEETEGDIQAIVDELQRKVDEGYFDGEDGFSPIAKVIQKSNGATIEIEDKNGKTTADVLNGKDGYTPVRGVDYWTEEDKQEVEEEATQQIEDKIEEYNENAAEKLNQYNQNSVQKTNDYNTNAEQKMSAYNTNATEKLSTYNSNATEKFNNYNSNAEQKETNYNTNASSKLSEYNSNAETKKSAYDENATQKTTSFNTNATNKLTEYNTNHTEKMSAYNSNSTQKLNAFNENATQKTEDFDEHTEEIQDNIEILQRTDNQILSRFNKDEEVSGQDITLTGTTEIKFAKPPLPMGNSEQESTEGTNLIGLDTNQYKVDLSAGDKLTITNNTAEQILMNFYSNYGDTQRNDWFSFAANSVRTITLATDTKAIAWTNAINGIAWCNSGETALTYEPYTNGASPNPDYPQEITNVTGDVEVKVQNKNFLNMDNSETGGIDSSGNIVSGNNLWRSNVYIEVEPNTTYTLSRKIFNDNLSRVIRLYEYDNNKTFISPRKESSTESLTITTTANTKYLKWTIFELNATLTKSTVQAWLLQLELGTATTYTPHQKQTFIFPLGNEKLMLGDYLADDGIHHVRKQVVLDGNSPITSSNYGINSYVLTLPSRAISNETDLLFISSHFKGIPANQRGTAPNVIYSNTVQQAEIRNTEFSTLASFKEWLEDNNPVVEYVLETEQIVPYTSAQQKVYNQIKNAYSYDEITIITGSSDGNKPFFTVQTYKDSNKDLNKNSNLVNGSNTGSLRSISSAIENETYTMGIGSFAVGTDTQASGEMSYAEGEGTKATGWTSHSEGTATEANGDGSHSEGYESKANGIYSHTEGFNTQADGYNQHVEGMNNIVDSNNKYAHIIGNGQSDENRSNAHTIDWQGNGWFQGNIKVGGTSQDDVNAQNLVTEDKYNRLKATLPTTTGEGEDVTLDKTAELEFKKPPLPMGNSEQESTTGRNLLPTPEVKSQTFNGVTISRFEDGTITIKGTPTAAMDVKFNFEEVTFSAGSYVHLRNNFATYNFAVSFRKNNINKFAPALIPLNNIQQITENITVDQMVVLCNNDAVGTAYNITLKPSIELTNEVTEYEKYTNGASPNPDYPQEITNVTGDVEVKVQNKNLWNANLPVLLQVANINTNNNGGIDITTYSNASLGYIVYDLGLIKKYKNKTLTLSIGNAANSIYRWCAFLNCDSNGNNRTELANMGGFSNKITITIGDNYTQSHLGVRLYVSDVSPNTTYPINNIQVEENTTSTPYTPHKEQVFPLTLGNIELCKIGDYQDYFYKESNKWYLHKEIGKTIYDGSIDENWTYYQGIIFIDNDNIRSKGSNVINLDFYTNYFKTGINKCYISHTTGQRLHVNLNTVGLSEITSANAWKTWLSTHNTIVYYELETPTDTEITDTTLISQLEAINNALSYEEQTNISSNQNALFSVEAYQSTKLVLEERDAKYESLEARVALLE